MKLINSFQASCGLALTLDDMAPAKGFMPLAVVQAIARRLNIASPVQPSVRQNLPVPFTMPVGPGGAIGATGAISMVQMEMPIVLPTGSIEVGGNAVTAVQTQIAADFSAINIIAVTTDDADQIAEAVLEVLEKEFAFRSLSKTVRSYASNLVFQFERSLEDYLRTLKEIQKIISPSMRAGVGVELEPMFERLTFAFDPLALPASKAQTPGFIIERRAGVPYSENRYFSGAPIRTRDHIHILERIEKVLEGTAG
jgi:hypothetical protein